MLSVRSKVVRLMTRAVYKLSSSKVAQRVQSSKQYEKSSQFVEERFKQFQETATHWGKDAYHTWEGKRMIFAERLEKEIDLKNQYRRIEEKMAQDLTELEVRKAVLEKEIQGKDRHLFDESYEYARKEIINKHLREASKIFHPQSSNKLKNELLSSFAKVLRGEKIAKSPSENLD